MLARFSSRRLFVVLALCVSSVLARAQASPPAELERVLIPIASEPLPGAQGALWETEIWLIAKRPDMFVGPIFDRNCVPPRCGPPPPPIPDAPFEAVQPVVYRTRAGEPPGILLFVNRGEADDLVLSTRVADASRRAVSEGVTVPVVREKDLVTGSAELLNLPVGPDVRVRLRVYDPFVTGNAVFRVRVFASRLEDRLTQELTLVLPRSTPDVIPGWDFPVQPDSAEIGINVDGYDPQERLRVEVTPLLATLRFWAFATVTNNNSNEVTIVTP